MMSEQPRRRWLWYLLGAVALLLAIGLVVPYFLDVDRYRETIASAIQQQTSRQVQIGKIRARLIPRVGFVIEDFRLGNPRGFPEGNLLTVDTIRGNLSWGPLLRREFQISSVELDHPKLTLLEDERGQVSYDIAPKKKAAASGGESGFRLGDIDTIRLRNVEVLLARVAGRSRAIVPEIHVAGISGEVGNVTFDAARLKQWTADADLSGVHGEIAGFQGNVEFRSGSFELRQGAIDSKFEGDLGKVARVKGTLHVADIEKSVAEFDLSTPMLDLDKLMAATVSTPAEPAETGKSELVAKGKISADRVHFSPLDASNGHAELRIFTDRIEGWPITLAFYGGSFGVSARLDKRQSPRRFSTNVEVRNADVGKLVSSMPGAAGKITGTGDMTLQAFGSLGSNLMNSLTGSGDFGVRNGKFPGLNLGNSMQALNKLQQVLSLGQSGGGSGETTFSLISGDLSIGGGRVSSNRVHADTSAGTVDLRGSFGFDQTLNYDGQASLIGGGSGGVTNPGNILTGVLGQITKQNVNKLSVPFAIRGTFSDPKIQPGRGLPSFTTAPSPAKQAAPDQQKPDLKKSILDLFKKP